MDILKDLNLISSSIDVEPIFIPNKGMVCSSLWNNCHILGSLSDFVPLFLLYFILK